MKLKKMILPLGFAAVITTIAVPMVSAGCGFNLKQTPHKKDGIKTSKGDFERLFADNKNNYYAKFTGSDHEEIARKNGLQDVTDYYQLLKKYVTIDEIEKYGRNYAWKWYYEDKGPKKVTFYLYSVPLAAIATQQPDFVAVNEQVKGDWRLIGIGSSKKLKKFQIDIKFDEV